MKTKHEISLWVLLFILSIILVLSFRETKAQVVTNNQYQVDYKNFQETPVQNYLYAGMLAADFIAIDQAGKYLTGTQRDIVATSVMAKTLIIFCIVEFGIRHNKCKKLYNKKYRIKRRCQIYY